MDKSVLSKRIFSLRNMVIPDSLSVGPNLQQYMEEHVFRVLVGVCKTIVFFSLSLSVQFLLFFFVLLQEGKDSSRSSGDKNDDDDICVHTFNDLSEDSDTELVENMYKPIGIYIYIISHIHSIITFFFLQDHNPGQSKSEREKAEQMSPRSRSYGMN